MTLSRKHRQELRAATRETAADLLEDLDHIRALLAQDAPSRRELRMLSNTLRRLLIIDRDLPKIATPRIGRIMLLAPDNKPYLEISRRRPLLLFISGGHKLFHVTSRAVTLFGASLTQADMKRMPTAEAAFRRIELRLDGFLAQPVLCFEGQWISRLDAIRYIAHIGSGVHSGRPKEQSDEILTKMRRSVTYSQATGIHLDTKSVTPDPPFTYNPDAIDVVLLEMLSAAKYIVESPAVETLEEMIRQEL